MISNKNRLISVISHFACGGTVCGFLPRGVSGRKFDAMKPFAILVLAGAVAGAACTAGGTDVNTVYAWSMALKSGDFAEVLDAFTSQSLPAWPAVNSVGFPYKDRIAPWDNACRALGVRLARGLEAFEAAMREEPDEAFLAHAGKMLAMRDGFARHCAYANLLLADALDRCVYVNLASRLARSAQVPDGFPALQEHLARFRPSTPELAEMVLFELGRAEPPDGLVAAASDGERLAALWELLEPGVPVGWPGTAPDTDAVSLLKTRNMLALLARLVGSDAVIHTHLPSLFLYRNAAADPPAFATYEEIKAVLSDTPAPESLGSKAYGITRAASAARELIADVESGKILNRLLFAAVDEPAETPVDTAAEKTYRDYPEWQLLDKFWFCDLMDDDELAARESLLAEGEAAWEAMMAVVRECDNDCVVGSALAILIESQGDKRAVVAELKDLFAKRLPQAGEVDEWTIYSMANAIAKMGEEEDGDVLIPMLDHSRWIVRVNGARFLGRLGGQKALEALERAKTQPQNQGPTEKDAIEEAIAAIEKRLAGNAEQTEKRSQP
jgi:hypothetical protein